MNRLTISLMAVFLAIFTSKSFATTFAEGETVFVAFPAADIKDDAFIIGKIISIMPSGDYKISVLDYVEGHDYGVSCVPMIKDEVNDVSKDDIWSLWTDTTKLNTQKLDYIVSKKDVLKLSYGKTYFIERNNIYIVFGRWKSDAPMLTAERMQEAKHQAIASGLSEMIPAFDLAIQHRHSFYGEFGRPLQPFETIAPLVKALKDIDRMFESESDLKNYWFSKHRVWKKIEKNTHLYFLIQAIDKVIGDAKAQQYEDGVDQAAPEDLEQLKQLLKKLARK